MEYIKSCDYEYITGKYHPNGDRFKRWDCVFDEKTGMDGDETRKAASPHRLRRECGALSLFLSHVHF